MADGRTYHVCLLLPLLLEPGADDALPEAGGHVGGVAGARDGRGVQRCQVRRGHRGPAGGQKVNHHQLLLQQDDHGRGVIELWKGRNVRTHKHTFKNTETKKADLGIERKLISPWGSIKFLCSTNMHL